MLTRNEVQHSAITKVKAYAKPPEAVMKTMCAVMTVMEKTPSWGQAGTSTVGSRSEHCKMLKDVKIAKARSVALFASVFQQQGNRGWNINITRAKRHLF